MVDINNYAVEKSCMYQNEEYLVRDNGAVLRKSKPEKPPRKLDDTWTFGKLNNRTGYLEIASVRIHRIVATAFLGIPPTKEHVVDHIDTNRQNNRPENLRWLTRFENAVFNEITRKKIEYRTGVSIYEFLNNPSAYRNKLTSSDLSWMRKVSDEEAKNCLNNFNNWVKSESASVLSDNGIGDWIYSPLSQSKTSIHNNINIKDNGLIDSLTPNSMQKNWNTPTKFLCCPTNITNTPILSYLENIIDNQLFATNRYGDIFVVKHSSINDTSIIVLTETASSIKPLALLKITYENNSYIHEGLGTFFTLEGAEKQYTLSQGLIWTGGDSIDDYC